MTDPSYEDPAVEWLLAGLHAIARYRGEIHRFTRAGDMLKAWINHYSDAIVEVWYLDDRELRARMTWARRCAANVLKNCKYRTNETRRIAVLEIRIASAFAASMEYALHTRHANLRAEAANHAKQMDLNGEVWAFQNSEAARSMPSASHSA